MNTGHEAEIHPTLDRSSLHRSVPYTYTFTHSFRPRGNLTSPIHQHVFGRWEGTREPKGNLHKNVQSMRNAAQTAKLRLEPEALEQPIITFIFPTIALLTHVSTHRPFSSDVFKGTSTHICIIMKFTRQISSQKCNKWTLRNPSCMSDAQSGLPVLLLHHYVSSPSFHMWTQYRYVWL